MSPYRKALEDMLRAWDQADTRNQAKVPPGNGRG
jgi:hypothetical protein